MEEHTWEKPGQVTIQRHLVYLEWAVLESLLWGWATAFFFNGVEACYTEVNSQPGLEKLGRS